ncbi:hypothetical protein N9P79_02530 [Crocinitomicaceae bacterium]|nr:hypothetical protein [Crocinitomicaceae bacterium]
MIKYKMDNRGKAAALVGLSAIGSILAYYGYSQYSNEEPDKTDIVEVKNDSNEPSDINDASSESISDTVSNYITKIVSGENIKLQVNEKNTVDLKKTGKEVLKEALEGDAPTDKKSDPRQTWSKYWTNEYNKQHTGEGDSVESTDADDKSADADDKREVVAADFN